MYAFSKKKSFKIFQSQVEIMSRLQYGQFKRFLQVSSRVLNEKAPPVPKEIRSTRPARLIPSTLGKDTINNAEFERLRVIPELATYYGGNALHDATIDRLNALVRRYMHLPTRQLSFEELHDVKFLSFDEYRNQYIKSEKVKEAHHKDLLNLLNRLRTIDGQLMPTEVIETLNEFISETGHVNTSSKVIKTFDDNGVAKAKGGKKTSRANVKIVDGEGLIMVNNVNYNQIFTREDDRNKITYPLLVTEQLGKLNIFATVTGGGISSKADAVRLGLVKVLGQINPIWKSRLNSANLRPTDLRIVERKKPGKLKARKSPTWVKR